LEPLDASGKRGDELVAALRASLERVGAEKKIVRVRVANVLPETLRTLPVNILSELKQQAFALDLRFEKRASPEETAGFGRAAIGRLDQNLVQFIESSDLEGFDKERLVRDALKYLGAET